MAKIIDIADAVLTALAAGTWSQAFSPVRAYRPVYALEQLKDLRVTVVPKSASETRLSRSDLMAEYRVDVAVQQRAATDAERDALMTLVEEFAAAFTGERLEGAAYAVCLHTDRQPIYDPEHLREHGVFTAVLTLTFEVP